MGDNPIPVIWDGAYAAGYLAGQRAAFERAAKIPEAWATSKPCSIHEDNPCCHVRMGRTITDLIRALTPEPPPA